MIMGCAADPGRRDRQIQSRLAAGALSGDHGTCAQGRMLVTRQRPLGSEGGPVISGRAAGPRVAYLWVVASIEARAG